MEKTALSSPYSACDPCGRLFVTLGEEAAGAEASCPDCGLPLQAISAQEGRRRFLRTRRPLGPRRLAGAGHPWN
jgi:hypothetical protein